MAKRTSAYGLNNPLQDVFPAPVISNRAPKSTDTNYEIGQQWVYTTTGQVYSLGSVVAGASSWTVLGPGSSDVDTITGDTGGPLSPSGGNISILGGSGITVAGAGSTLTINRDAESGFPITPYVVGPVGVAGFQTIQSAIDAANTDGGGVVFIQPGTYTENLTLYDEIVLWGTSEQTTIINGSHTPPTSGVLNIFRLSFVGNTSILTSAAAGTTAIIMEDCSINVTNGWAFDLLNWTGSIGLFDIGPAGTNDGAIRNTGGALVLIFSEGLGNGTGNSMQLSGTTIMTTSNFGCPITCVTGASLSSVYGCRFDHTITFSNDSSATFFNCSFNTGATAAIAMDSSGNVALNACAINSSNNPAISGTGAGTLSLNGVDFASNASLASTLTISGGTSMAGTFSTETLAAHLSISGTTITAAGSDANISITATPKGTGDFVVTVGDIQDTAGDIIATRSSAGADVTVEATNSDNTNAASRAGFEAAVGGTSAGDPYVNFLISGGQAFTMGIDNSTANDDFVISDNATLGTNNRVSIDGTSGVVTLGSGLTVTGTTLINNSNNANSSINTGTSTGTVGIGNSLAGAVTVTSSSTIGLVGTTEVNASNNANTSINTGTSTGTVSIGNALAGAITADTAAGISLDGATASNFTVTGASADLTLSSAGGSVNVTATEAVSDAIVINASDAAGGVQLRAGTAGTQVFGNLLLSNVATQIQMNGGAVTDFIGQATLATGTVTVANTNIAAGDRVFLTRSSLNGSTALGELVSVITPATNFVISSVSVADGTTVIAGDASIVDYVIVRQF